MRRKKAFVLLFVLILLVSGAGSLTFGAEQKNNVVYTNATTGYDVVILDELDLLDAEQESELRSSMIPVSEYGNVIFWTTKENASNEIEQARLKRRELYERSSAVIFMINLGIRKLTIQSDGDILKYVTKSLARTITDNVSYYASNEEYALCARNAFSEIYETLRGERIAEPMRYLSIAGIALMVGTIAAILLVFGRQRNPLLKTEHKQFQCVRGKQEPTIRSITFLKQTKRYSPQSSDSGCGGGGGGGGCGGGGGGCGGGGSASF